MKKGKNVHSLVIIIIYILFGYGNVFSQNRNCNKLVIPTIESNRDNEDGELYFSDSLIRKIRIIFERDFDDSVTIYLNQTLVFDSIIKTSPSIGASKRFIDINYSKYDQLPKISVLLRRGNCVYFYPVVGKRVLYVNYSKGFWNLEYSNIQRQYR